MSEAEAAKLELAKCEQEIGQVKALLRALGPAGEAADDQNTLSVAWIAVSTQFATNNFVSFSSKFKG